MKSKSESNRIRQSSPQHRRSARRRLANRMRIVVTVLGSLSFVFALLFLIISLWRDEIFPDGPTWQICLAYAGGGILLFLIRALLGRSSHRHRRKRGAAPPRVDPRKSGMILIVALILLGAMSALALYLQQAAYVARQTDVRQLARTQLRLALIDEGFARLQQLADDPEREVDHLEKEWLAPREVERPDGIVTLSRIRDLNRYADLNNLYLPDTFASENLAESLLADIMTHAGDFTPLERLVAIQDWINPKDEGIRASDFYLQQDPAYEVPNTWMHHWTELLWVEGIDLDYFEPHPLYRVGRPFEADINRLITVIPAPRDRPIPININTAAPELLEAISGPDRTQIARLIQATRMDRPIRSIDVLRPYLEPGAIEIMRPFIGVQSSHFALDVMASDLQIRLYARAIVERHDDGRVQILQWVMH